ncbi:MAG TPA: FtsQ-type POTRA domain-containing protein [Candidatus Magasanikbacteria bacterium]|nr:FtsQ-type POTRA domain-containing protein [Candidatus Magasanikbacteria bacterium]
MKKFFNRYKLKRKLGRQIQSASKFVFSYNQINKHKDYDWRKPKSNPFKKTTEINWKKRIEIFLLIFTILATFITIIYSSFFKIKNIEISGLKRINNQELIENITNITNYKSFLIIPKNNYFTIDLNEIIFILKQKYPIQNITIQKIFPDKIKVEVEEKISKIIYNDGRIYTYLDETGKVIEILRYVGEDEWLITKKSVTSTNELGEEIITEKEVARKPKISINKITQEMGDYPIIYRQNNGDDLKINDLVLDQNKISGIIQWFNLLEKRTDINFTYFFIENDFGEGIIKTSDGWEIKVKITTDIINQFNELEYLLKNKIDKNNLSYIDLRYSGRVYWK